MPSRRPITPIGTMPDERSEVEMWLESTLDIPECCPVSLNPRPGSTVTIHYRVNGRVLEVDSLFDYLQSFVDGHRDGTRNMETMIQKIACDCAHALQTSVRVVAELNLLPVQRLRVSCTYTPDDLLPRHSSTRVAGADAPAPLRVPAPPL